ncbi:transglycosylase SLT domain-containing protein [Sporosalibacterium faouarense]|uniref:transglycosylase SLT domain-containing protein n=1 Tax=Sporosalibacterium faouarense TaxID=516123 RepID=UPI00192C3419|nr:transglycosylase SLT domain-containing protein [Sporosalibacterium faouarense]
MKKKLLYILIPFMTLLLSSNVYGAKHSDAEDRLYTTGIIFDQASVDEIMAYIYRDDNNKIDFISDASGLSKEDSKFLLEECESKELDVFLVLGLMKLESRFDTRAVGSLGERGLGQLMENTARPIAENLDLEYEPDMLFIPRYNIKLFTTQLKYLNKIFDNDVHKVLTAYNRGAYGLKKYMASRSTRQNPAISSYSNRVLEFRNEFYNDFQSKQHTY